MLEIKNANDMQKNQLLLFTSGNAPRSQRARQNLRDAIQRLNLEGIEIREIDLLSTPRTGIDYSVFAAPALMLVTSNGEQQLLYGDLSESDKVDAMLATVQGS